MIQIKAEVSVPGTGRELHLHRMLHSGETAAVAEVLQDLRSQVEHLMAVQRPAGREPAATAEGTS